MNYGGFKDLPRRTAADNLLHEKAFDIAKDPKHDGYQQGFASMVFNFFFCIKCLPVLLVVLLKIRLHNINN